MELISTRQRVSRLTQRTVLLILPIMEGHIRPRHIRETNLDQKRVL